jgi:hypothetical protein
MDPLGPWNLRRLAQCFPRPPKRPARDPPPGGANLASPRPPKTHSWDWKSLSRIPPVGPDRSESATSRRRDANDTIVQSDDVSSHCAAKWCLQSRGGNRETRDDHRWPEVPEAPSSNEAQVACLTHGVSVFEGTGLFLSSGELHFLGIRHTYHFQRCD